MSDQAARSIRPLSGHEVRSYAFSHAGFIALEIALLVPLLALSVLVKRNPGPLPGDIGLDLDTQHWLLPHPVVAKPIEAVSTLNWPIPAAITIAVVLVTFLLLRRWLDAVFTLITAAVTDESSFLLNRFIHRPRPVGHGILSLDTLKSTYSFPSGHVTHAIAVFGLFLFLSSQIRMNGMTPRPVHPALIWTIRVVLVAAIVLMPISRMLEGEHWPSDVLGGILYGAFFLVIAAHMYLWARRRWPRLLAADER